MSPSTTLTKCLILSDTHGFTFDNDFAPADCPLMSPTPTDIDVLIHCGDLTQVGGMSEFKKALQMLSKFDAELKLVIGGNHDLELDAAFDPDEPEDHSDALALWTGPEAKAAGVTYLVEGTHHFTLSKGAKLKVYASPYQPAFGDWAFGYQHNEDRFNTPENVAESSTSIAENPVPDYVDIMITHGPPKGILDLDTHVKEGEDQHLGCKNLLHAVQRVRPLMHCFGHIHEGYGHDLIKWSKREEDHLNDATPLKVTPMQQQTSTKEYTMRRGENTLMVNAALQTGPSEWRNAPMLVELQLPLCG